MRLTLSALLLLAISIAASAQDLMYTKDGKKEEVKVLEIRPNEIRYKKNSNPDGPEYVIAKSSVLLITYANGTHESFARHKAPPVSHVRTPARVKPFDSLSVNYGKNLVSHNAVDMISTNITFSYERFLANGKLGIRLPFSIGFGDSKLYYDTYSESIGPTTVMATGIDLNFYPGGQGSVKYFIAPSFLLTTFNYQYTENYFDPNLGYWLTIEELRVGRQYAGLLKHGVLLQVARNFNMSFVFGLGLRQNETVYQDITRTKVSFEFNMGYRF